MKSNHEYIEVSSITFNDLRNKIANRPDLVITVFIFLVSIIIHILTSARTVTFSDSGDFLMAISTIGNCHGPGYPLYLMTAKLFTWILPFGSLAFKVSLYSGIAASVTACLVYRIVLRITNSRLGGVIAAFAFCFSYTFWYQTVIPETYGLNALFITSLILLALRWENFVNNKNTRKTNRTLAIFALTYGLAITNNFAIMFLLPAFLFFALNTDLRSVVSLRNILRIAVFFVVGLLPFLYQPISALLNPAYNYGDPSTLTNWFRHVTLYYQRGGLFGYPASLFPGRLWRYFGTLTTEFPYFAWLGGVGFLCSFHKRNNKYPIFLLLLFLLTLLPAMTYNQIESVLRAHFYYPSYLIFSLWIGIGAAYLIKLVKRWSNKREDLVGVVALSLVIIILFISPVLSAIIHYSKVDKSNYYYAYDMAKRILETAEPGSIVLFDSDNTYFPCRYLQVVEGLYKDIRVVHPHSAGVPGFGNEDLWVNIPPNSRPSPGDKDYITLVESLFHTVPVYHTTPFATIPNWKQVWYGYLIRVYPNDIEPEPIHDFFIDIRGQDRPLIDLDSDAREALLLPSALKANQEVWQTDYEEASEIYREITDLFTDDLYVPTLYSCETYSFLFDTWGQVLNLMGKFKETVQFLPRANVINPNFVSLALVNALNQEGNFFKALNELNKYLTVFPENVEAQIQKGIVLLNLDDYTSAVDKFEEISRIDSTNPRLHYFLGLAYLEVGNTEGAVEQFNITIELDPSGEFALGAKKQLDQMMQPGI